MTDAVSINYVQDILVNPASHNKGIGSNLVNRVFDEYKKVRTHILLTDDEPSQLAFYKKLNMTNTKDSAEYPLNVFIKFKGD